MSAVDLGVAAVKAVIEDAGIDSNTVDEVIFGCVLTSGVGQAPARQIALGAGLSQKTQAMTVNKVCSSGLKAVMLAANEILLGNANAIVAGGTESMSQAPYLLSKMRAGAKLGHSKAEDSILKDALWDVYNDTHMGNCAEMCAEEFSLSREDQDSFAIESYKRANQAIASGAFKNEIVPIDIAQRKKTITISEDEEPARAKPEKIPQLKAVFKKDGTVTAANASSINDGAAALLVCSEVYAKEHNLKPLVEIKSTAWFAQEPELFTTAPVGAVKSALDKSKTSIDEIDLFEINEAFSAVALACGSSLKIPSDKLNVNGGAVALGHPVGASGARILVTLIHALVSRGLKKGVAGICNGGGEATSIVVEVA